MAAMTGIAVTFLFLVPVIPLVIFPFVIAGTLIARWIADCDWSRFGAFLIGGGSLLAVMEDKAGERPCRSRGHDAGLVADSDGGRSIARDPRGCAARPDPVAHPAEGLRW